MGKSDDIAAGRSPWCVLRTGLRPAADNMAIDELLLEEAVARGKPVLRFYGWAEPAATFGYFQRYALVAAASPLRPLIRRPTGGGIVPHDADWTYSIVAPPTDSWWTLTARASYERLHRWLDEAFRSLGVATTLAPEPRTEPVAECFMAPEQHDLTWQGRKIAGAAQRRNRLGLLVQGSVQPPATGLTRASWEKAMLEVARARWDVEWTEMTLSSAQEASVMAKVQARYGREEYNRKR